MPLFPSADWFDRVRAEFNSDDSFRHGGGGTCDAKVGVKVGDRAFLILFEGFGCSEAREISDGDLEDADFYLEMGLEQWEEMLRNIKENGEADLNHTLNTLDMGLEDGLAQSLHGDQYRQDFFFRYNQTFQYFFDASARVETSFQSSAPAATHSES